MSRGWAATALTVDQLRTRHTTPLTSTLAARIADIERGSLNDPTSLPAVYAAVRLIVTVIDNLPVTVSRGPVPTWLRRPRRYGCPIDQSDLVQWMLSSMALHGAAYLRCTRLGESWRLDPVRPGAVQHRTTTGGVYERTFALDGQPIDHVPHSPDDAVQRRAYLLHVPYMVTPEHPEGFGPLQALRDAMAGYLTTERYALTLFDRGTHSGGRLETDQELAPATAQRYQSRWVEARKTGDIPVLGSGLRYVNDIINARDAAWIEARQYNAAQVAKAFGIPASYMNEALAGGQSSLSYANAQDNRRNLRETCLATFTNPLEEGLSLLLPPGRDETEDVRVRFDYTEWEAADEPTDPAADAQ